MTAQNDLGLVLRQNNHGLLWTKPVVLEAFSMAVAVFLLTSLKTCCIKMNNFVPRELLSSHVLEAARI